MLARDATKCPKPDNTLEPQIPKDGKEADRALSCLQALLLDTVGHLSSGTLEMQQGGCLTGEATTQVL
jgi:hypothetical protein